VNLSQIKKIFAIVLAWTLVLPGFAAAADDAVLPPVPASGNVTLPLDEYNRLLELANKPAHKVDTPPVPYSLKRADLKFRVTDDAVQGTVQLQGEILHKGATKIPLTTGMAILDARQEGKSLPFELDNGTHTAVITGPSDFNVTLDAGLPLSIEAGRASISLPVPAAGSARLSFVVPGDHTAVHLNSGLITSKSSEKGQTTIEATLVPGKPANIWWTTREVALPVVPKEARFLSDVKTLVSISEADIRIAALADVTVVQGEPTQFHIPVPAGYEVSGVTGSSIDSSEVESGILTVTIASPVQRNHQFLISMEKSISAAKTDAPFVYLKDSQRETGEILVEGAGTIELNASESGGLKRMDFKEVNPYLRSLSRFPMQAAFRFHKQPDQNPALALEWTRFPDSSVLAAVAERAVVTTLVTTEGRSLTEVKLTIKNQAQPFLKVALPTGTSILTAEVAGEKVKPVEGPDGNRVPLLRAGFRPVDSYTVSFTFMHSGAPFAKKGGSDLTLPKMDVAIDLLQWEVFLPEQYKVKDFGGDAISANLFPQTGDEISAVGFVGGIGYGYSYGAAAGAVTKYEPVSLLPGQLGGIVIDPTGAVVSNARISVTQTSTGATRVATTDSAGRWLVYGIQSGQVKVSVSASSFKAFDIQGYYDANRPTPFNAALQIGAAMETVEVTASNAPLNGSSIDLDQIRRDSKKQKELQQTAASQNVTALQQRVSGVFPVRIDVPRAGNSYNFVRPLVLDEETKVTFTYKSK
jgi:hypothetical protein